MGYEYAKRKSALPVNGDTRASREAQAPHVSMDSLRTALGVDGAGGQRVDLESAMRSKMERMFGMDLQNLKLYVSQQVDDAGAEAAASGNIIAFAPGKLDLSTRSGQALLGHELSHVAAQARGETQGGGFLDSPAMEARADREGAMAAAGQPVYGGGPAASLPATASGPIQAKKKKAAPSQPAPPAQQTQPAPAASNGNGTQSGSGMKPLLFGLAKDYENRKEAVEGGDRIASTNAAFDMAADTVPLLKGGLSGGKSVASLLGQTALNAGLGYAASGATLLTNGLQATKDMYNIASEHGIQKSMKKQEAALNKRTAGRNRTEDEEELAQTMQQAGDMSKVRGTEAKVNLFGHGTQMLENGLNLAGTLSGAAAVTTPIAYALTGLRTGGQQVGKEIVDYQRHNAKKRVADRKFNTTGAVNTVKNEDRFKNIREHAGMSEDQYAMAQLMSHGIASGTAEETNDVLARERSERSVEGARGGNQDYADLVAGMKVDASADKAKDTVYKRLGGTENEYHNWKYNDFQKGADESAASDAEIAKVGKLKYYGGKAGGAVKSLARWGWDSLKTGAKNLGGLVAGGAKKAWGGLKSGASFIGNLLTSKDARAEAAAKIKTGAKSMGQSIAKGVSSVGQGVKNGASFIGNLLTSKDARAEAAAKIKTGASNAWESVKAAPGKAWNTVKDFGKYEVGKVKDWYHHGVDQLNMNRDTYDKMGFLDRAKWSLTNLPARLMAGSDRSKLKTARRMNANINMDQLAGIFKKEREEQTV